MNKQTKNTIIVGGALARDLAVAYTLIFQESFTIEEQFSRPIHRYF